MSGEGKRTFSAALEEANGVGGRFVRCPFEGRDVFGEARAPVVGTVNGHPFRSRLMVYGGQTYLGFTKAVREAAGLQDGARLRIVLERDVEAREVELPEALVRALDAEPTLRETFTRLAYSHRKEYVQWITEARREDTRERRVTQTLERLRALHVKPGK